MRFAVPQLQALHHAVTSQRNSAASSPPADNFANLQFLSLTIAIVDHDAVKLDRRIVYANLQEAVTAGIFADFNIVMIMLAVNMCLAKIDPVFRMGCRSKTKQQRRGKK